MRFYVPNKIIQDADDEENNSTNGVKKQNGDTSSHKSNISKEVKYKDATSLKEDIIKITSASNLGDAIAVLTEVQMMYPRGKINIHFLKSIFKITGPSHDYKIQYNHINRAFILPKQDGINMAFVVGLTTPMRQGNTNYSFIVFQIKKNTVVNLSLNLPENENEKNKMLKHPIENPIEADLYDIMAKLFKSIIGIGVIIPGKFKR